MADALDHHHREDGCRHHEDDQSDGDSDDPPSDRLLDHRSGEFLQALSEGRGDVFFLQEEVGLARELQIAELPIIQREGRSALIHVNPYWSAPRGYGTETTTIDPHQIRSVRSCDDWLTCPFPLFWDFVAGPKREGRDCR